MKQEMTYINIDFTITDFGMGGDDMSLLRIGIS